MLGIAEEWHSYPQTWLRKAALLDLYFTEQYIYSMYWSITTMTTGKQTILTMSFYSITYPVINPSIQLSTKTNLPFSFGD